jgi:hypothetical protein
MPAGRRPGAVRPGLLSLRFLLTSLVKNVILIFYSGGGKTVRYVKGLVIVLVCLALAASVGPLLAEDDVQDPNPPGSGSGWSVTCNYNGNQVLTSMSCTSGGGASCACPRL